MAAAVAARTRRVRIGTAVVLAASRSDSSGPRRPRVKFSMFGVDRAHRIDATITAVRRHTQSYGPRPSVTPLPVQDPVPLWLGFAGPRGARSAGRLGAGLLTLDRSGGGNHT